MIECPICTREVNGPNSYNGVRCCSGCFRTMIRMSDAQNSLRMCATWALQSMENSTEKRMMLEEAFLREVKEYHIEFEDGTMMKMKPKQPKQDEN